MTIKVIFGTALINAVSVENLNGLHREVINLGFYLRKGILYISKSSVSYTHNLNRKERVKSPLFIISSILVYKSL